MLYTDEIFEAIEEYVAARIEYSSKESTDDLRLINARKELKRVLIDVTFHINDGCQ